MESSSLSRDDCLALLRQAFPPTPLDPDAVLEFSDCATLFSGNEDAEAFRALVRGISWPLIVADKLDSYHDILFFLRGSGFAALLPAFLAASLTDFDRFSRLAELISTLFTKALTEAERFKSRVSWLTREQRIAVAASLQFLATQFAQKWQSNPAKDALRDFLEENNQGEV